jgi:hypothetical protein
MSLDEEGRFRMASRCHERDDTQPALFGKSSFLTDWPNPPVAKFYQEQFSLGDCSWQMGVGEKGRNRQRRALSGWHLRWGEAPDEPVLADGHHRTSGSRGRSPHQNL